MLALCIWRALPLFITAISFLSYTALEGKPLVPSVAFPALTLFVLLRIPLQRLADITAQLQQSKASIDRIERFLEESETAKYYQLRKISERQASIPFIGFQQATFRWGFSGLDQNENVPSFCLSELDIQFHDSCMNVIIGPTGSGKTSLLMALLGEMTLLRGSVHLPGCGHGDLKQGPATGLLGSVAFCSQESWLLNDTIKQNITFASPWDEQRYLQVLDAGTLSRDLEILVDGDDTFVREKGIVISGGQKQRISLARALYSRARYILLDDTLSAVDSHTAEHILDSLHGPLTKYRTIILVTNNAPLCVPRSQFVVMLANGSVIAQGHPEDLIAAGCLEQSMLPPKSSSKVDASSPTSKARSIMSLHSDDDSTDSAGERKRTAKKKAGSQLAIQNGNMRTEEVAEGAVRRSTYGFYLKLMGPWYFWVLMLTGFSADSVCSILANNLAEDLVECIHGRCRYWKSSKRFPSDWIFLFRSEHLTS